MADLYDYIEQVAQQPKQARVKGVSVTQFNLKDLIFAAEFLRVFRESTLPKSAEAEGAVAGVAYRKLVPSGTVIQV